jgi:inner membrane protein
MMFKTHLAFGFLVALFMVKFFAPANEILFFSLVIIASVLPDIDHPNSKIGKNFKLVGFLFEHRGFFHSVFALMLLFAVLLFFIKSYILGIAVLTGYGAHIFIDAFSKQGIMPFHPLSRFRISGFIKTNGIAEYLIFLLIVLADIIKIVKM